MWLTCKLFNPCFVKVKWLYYSQIWRRKKSWAIVGPIKVAPPPNNLGLRSYDIWWCFLMDFTVLLIFLILNCLSISSVWVLLCACVDGPQACSVLVKGRRDHDADLKLALLTAVSQPVGSGGQAWVLCRSKRSYLWTVSPAQTRVASQFWVGVFALNFWKYSFTQKEMNAHSISFVTFRWKPVLKCQVVEGSSWMLF